MDNAIHQINHYPAGSVVCFVNTYLLDSDVYIGWCYPAFKQLGPNNYSIFDGNTESEGLSKMNVDTVQYFCDIINIIYSGIGMTRIIQHPQVPALIKGTVLP